MNQWQHDNLRVNGVRLHYYRSPGISGHARPALVLVHGFTDNALYWSRTAEALVEGFDIVAYDARGHGASERARGVFNDEQRALDLLGVIDALKLEKPVAIGHSMGGSTIANAAAMRPDGFRALVLEDPAWWELPEGVSSEQLQHAATAMKDRTTAWRDWVKQLQAVPYEQALAMVKAGSPEWSEHDATLSCNARLQFELALFEHYPPPQAPWRGAVSAVKCPLLLLLGSERNAIITPDTANEVMTRCPGAPWVQVPGAGHAIRFDQFDRFLGAVRSFLAGL
jgi:pimeloyl-ACP methyl ester carboxylesterase